MVSEQAHRPVVGVEQQPRLAVDDGNAVRRLGQLHDSMVTEWEHTIDDQDIGIVETEAPVQVAGDPAANGAIVVEAWDVAVEGQPDPDIAAVLECAAGGRRNRPRQPQHEGRHPGDTVCQRPNRHPHQPTFLR